MAASVPWCSSDLKVIFTFINTALLLFSRSHLTVKALLLRSLAPASRERTICWNNTCFPVCVDTGIQLGHREFSTNTWTSWNPSISRKDSFWGAHWHLDLRSDTPRNRQCPQVGRTSLPTALWSYYSRGEWVSSNCPPLYENPLHCSVEQLSF